MKYRRYAKTIAFILAVVIFILPITAQKNAEAAIKKYGIVVSDNSGNYSFYDLNSGTEETETIEITKSGNIMVPLKKLCKLIPGLTYSYDSARKTATVVNTYNGKKIVYTRSSRYLNYYSDPKAKASRKTMTYKMYVSDKSSLVMVHMSSLKWVMGTTGGYRYYKPADMQKSGFDTLLYSGLVVYNPTSAITAIPVAANVKGISITVKVTIPEGYSVAQTFDLLVKKGVCASADLLYDAMENYDFTYYPLVSEIVDNENRSNKLEGYLYPDTYEFYRLSKGQDVIGKFLRNTEAKLTVEDREKALTMDYSMDELLTVASMIEKETGDPKLMPNIASVIYNRLNIKQKLQLDCTYFYLKRYVQPYISGDIKRYNSFYDTYTCAALPAGPICNPGITAIKAALNPAVTDYLYFYSDEEGIYHFSKEWVNLEPSVTPAPSVTPVIPTVTPAILE